MTARAAAWSTLSARMAAGTFTSVSPGNSPAVNFRSLIDTR
jgi:hypothetical protein